MGFIILITLYFLFAFSILIFVFLSIARTLNNLEEKNPNGKLNKIHLLLNKKFHQIIL